METVAQLLLQSWNVLSNAPYVFISSMLIEK